MNKEVLKERIWRIVDGVPLNVGSMTIKASDSDKLSVTGWTNTIHFKNITQDSIVRELRELKYSFTALTESFEELNTIVNDNNLTIEYHIAFGDSGKAGIGLCSEIDGVINWYIE